MHLKTLCVLLCVVWQCSALTPCYDQVHQTCGGENFSGEDASNAGLACTAEWGAFPRLSTETNKLISLHLTHSMEYLLKASHFNEWTVNRPGFTNYFSRLADEEWDSAIALMTHMLKRGGKLEDNLFKVDIPKTFQNRQNEIESLAWALDQEKDMATKTLHLAYSANHVTKDVPKELQNAPRDAEFADFLAERISDINVLRIKHLSNYVNILSQLMGSDVDKAYAMFTFDHEILK